MNEWILAAALVSTFVLGFVLGLGFTRRRRMLTCDLCKNESIYISKKCSNCLRQEK